MTFAGLQLRELRFVGPGKVLAAVVFGPQLNVVSGASQTGKSFMISAIDFMLGSRQPLRDIPEREGYDTVLLCLESTDGGAYTLQRSVIGGDFLVRPGRHMDSLRPDEASHLSGVDKLKPRHQAGRDDNLSQFLLGLIGLKGKRLRRNRSGDTQPLSFRNLAHLAIVGEERIITQGSPVLSGQVVTKTSEQAVFKLLLTGLDDSAIVSPQRNKASRNEAEREVISELANDLAEELADFAFDPEEASRELERIEEALAHARDTLTAHRETWVSIEEQRRHSWACYSQSRQRREEITELLERFALLESAYSSDVRRLEAIRETGTFLLAFEPGNCPLCGALPDAQASAEEVTAADVGRVIAACDAEIAKIERVRKELKATTASLRFESQDVVDAERQYRFAFDQAQKQLNDAISPSLAVAQEKYVSLVEKRAELQRAMALRERLVQLETRLAIVDDGGDMTAGDAIGDELPASVVGRFCEDLERTLMAWRLPNTRRVFFNPRAYDFEIDNKPRGSNGKGIRAITHAAFATTLLRFCRRENKSHPGFVVLDTPLRAYREPDGPEEEQLDEELKNNFFRDLASVSDDLQIIVIENDEPPEDVCAHICYTHFTGNPYIGRQGFFPPSRRAS